MESLGAKSEGAESMQDEVSEKSQVVVSKRRRKRPRGEQRVSEEQSSKKSSEELQGKVKASIPVLQKTVHGEEFSEEQSSKESSDEEEVVIHVDATEVKMTFTVDPEARVLLPKLLKLADDYDKALEQGRVKVAYGCVMILGPGGVGKSSLLKGLKNEQLPEEANSTQMAEISTLQPGTRSLSREASSHQASSEEAEAYWTDVTKEDEMKELVGLVHRVYNVSSGSITSSKGLSTSSAERSDTVSKVHKIISKVINLALQDPSIQASESQVLLSTWDCGGQQVFLSILSAFLTSKSMFFLMFDARYPLRDRRISLLHHRGNVTEHVEEVSAAELLLQWMSCIDATLSDPSSKTPQYPRILPIGTHGDDERVKKEKEDILKQLYEEYRGKSFLRLIPEKGFIIDNTTAGKGDCEDPGYKKILKMVHEFASKKLAEDDTPVTWVLFRVVIKKIAKPCLKMEEVKEIARACMIPEDSVPSVLKFYHDRAVFLHYSHISSLKDYVIANPQWLIRQIAKVLDLNESTCLQNVQEILKKSGILVEDLYTKVLETTTTLPPQAIVDLLEDFLILTPVDTGSKVHPFKGKEYFVPSVLLPLLDNTSATSTESIKKAASLHVIFPNVNYLPPGYFSRLAIVLSKEPGFNLAFGCDFYRNMIPFIVGESGSKIDTLTITKCVSSVQIDIMRDTPRQNDNPFFFEVCQKVISTIEKCSDHVREWFPHIEISFAFRCDKCSSISEHFVPLNLQEHTTESQVRCQEQTLYSFNHDEKYWLKVKDIQSTNPLSDAEIAVIASEVKMEPEKLAQLKDELEMTKECTKDPEVLIKRWRRKMKNLKEKFSPRSYLVHYFKCINLHEIAERIKYEEIFSSNSSDVIKDGRLFSDSVGHSTLTQGPQQSQPSSVVPPQLPDSYAGVPNQFQASAGTGHPSNRDVQEVVKDLNSVKMSQWLCTKGLSEEDCEKIKEGNISGRAFLQCSKEDWTKLNISVGGIYTLMDLQKEIRPFSDSVDHSTLIQGPQQSQPSSVTPPQLSGVPNPFQGSAGTGHPSNRDVQEVVKDLNPVKMSQWLHTKGLSEKDCEKIKEGNISGRAFLRCSEEDWTQLNVSLGGIYTLVDLQEEIRPFSDSVGHSTLTQGPQQSQPSSVALPQLSGQNTTRPDHNDIYQKLQPYASKWRAIAIGLRFTPAELDNIAANPSHFTTAPGSYLSAMLSDWLEWAPGDARGSTKYATMEDLRSAVDRAGLGLTASEL